MNHGMIILTDLAAPDGETHLHWRLPALEAILSASQPVGRFKDYESWLSHRIKPSVGRSVQLASVGPAPIEASASRLDGAQQPGRYFVSLLAVNIGLSSIAVTELVDVRNHTGHAIKALLQAHFAADGWQWLDFGSYWRLTTPRVFDWQTPKAAQLVGRDLREVAVTGADSRLLRLKLTEAEMLLHAFKSHEPQAYGLWIWGHGESTLPPWTRPVVLVGEDEFVATWSAQQQILPSDQELKAALRARGDACDVIAFLPTVESIAITASALDPTESRDWARELDKRLVQQLSVFAQAGITNVSLYLDGYVFELKRASAITRWWRSRVLTPKAWWAYLC